ncbi:MAG: hypothetical protein H7A44_11165 [Opitutaceae bacterium]|nr:hypothetical protein [Opitutaceae bacterium]
MKNIRKIIHTSFALLATSVALAAKPIPGPKGGKIVTTEAPHVEFFVEKDRSVSVSFYDKDLNPLAPSGQVISVVAQAKTGKAKLAFAPKDGALVSTTKLPEGDGYRIVVQVRDTAQAKPKNYRVEFHDEVCGECKRAEYACICDDAGGDKHEH